MQAMMGMMHPVLYDMMQATWRQNHPEWWAQQHRTTHPRWQQPDVAGPSNSYFGSQGHGQPAAGNTGGDFPAVPPTPVMPAHAENRSFAAAPSQQWATTEAHEQIASQPLATSPIPNEPRAGITPQYMPAQGTSQEQSPREAAVAEVVTEQQLSSRATGTAMGNPQRQREQDQPSGDRGPSTGENPSIIISHETVSPLVVGVSPLSNAVPNSIKQRIWAHEYVDLASLLKQETKQQMRVELTQEGQLLCTPQNQRAK